ncbi:MAG: CRP-like cAMP-binding protein [Nonlabens sp.]|jgi:CRP-like cAMP-binding protein
MILTQITPQYTPPDLRPPTVMVDEDIKTIEKFYGRLYKEGEKLNQLFLLVEGKVLLSKKNEKGRKVKLPPIESGSFFGLQSLRGFHLSSHSAWVSRPSKLLVIPYDRLPDFIKRWPAVKDHMISQLISQVDKLNSDLSY